MTEPEMGLNRRLMRAVYPTIDFDQYDREVIAETAGIDVERLAEALSWTWPDVDLPEPEDWAVAIAAEYARLAQDRSPEPSE